MPRSMGRLAGLVVAVTAFCAPAAGQDWPSKPVRVVVPWPPGGSADLLGRMMADRLSAKYGQPFVVENRPGASGTVGSAAVARAERDGYTLLLSGIPSHVVAPAMSATAGFDPVKDFTHIAYLGGSPIAVVVHPSLGVTSLPALLERLRKSGEVIDYVSPGVGSLGHLLAEFWARKENVKLNHVPYRGGNQAATDLLGGQVRLGFMTWATTAEQIRGGKLSALAVSSKQRMDGFAEVPTLRELGSDDLTTLTWWSLSAPAGISADVVRKVNTEVGAALVDPEIRKKLLQQTIETEAMSPEAFTAFVAAEVSKWQPIAKTAVAEPQR